MCNFAIKNLNPQSNIHMIGIGGISMSALAKILMTMGHNVTGSDATPSNLTELLSAQGARITIGHSAENVKNADLVCYTAAISNDNPELTAAIAAGIPAIERAELLGEIMTLYKYPINIAGTHGKTTTTGMLSLVLLAANVDPTILIGGELPQLGSNHRIGADKYLVCEACEYVESFLKFKPYLSIITNIEEDHLDYFKDINHIISSFRKFAELTAENGYIVACYDDKNIISCLKDINVPIISYGISTADCDFTAKNIQTMPQGGSVFKVYHKSEFYADITLNVAGLHNVRNALSVIATAFALGIPNEAVKSGLEEFTGTKRRFEKVGKTKAGTQIIDDYAHHPTEITATLTSAQKMAYNKIWCIFQPHTYTRTKAFAGDFAKALSIANHVIVTDIYAAREENTVGANSSDITEKLPKSIHMSSFEEIANYTAKNANPDDLIITMGAGDVYKIGKMLTE